MELISKTQRINTTIVGKINDVTININFEQKPGEQPQAIQASCNFPSTVEGEQPTYVSVNRQANGQRQVSMNGNKNIIELYPVIEEIEAELEIIAMEGVVA